MSVLVAETKSLSPRLPKDTAVAGVPVVDLAADSAHRAQQIVSDAATSSGLVFVRNLPHRPDFAAIQRLFDTLYQSPALAARLNAVYPKRGIFKVAGKLTDDETVDEKATIDLSAQRLSHMNDAVLREALGEAFEQAVQFFRAVEEQLVPLILTATSQVISRTRHVDLRDIHRDGNNNFRLADYHYSSPHRHGCGEHTDYGTATIIFQDGSGGLEFQDPLTREWYTVPGHETVIVWGWCGHILSGGKITPAKHRVQTVHASRRNTAVCFVAPDLHAPLQPLVPGKYGFAEEIAKGRVTVGEFKEMLGKKWRWREGTERNEEDAMPMSQDDDIVRFLYGS